MRDARLDPANVPPHSDSARRGAARSPTWAGALATILVVAVGLRGQTLDSGVHAAPPTLGPAPIARSPEFLATIEPPLLREAFARCATLLADGDPSAVAPRERAFLLLGWLRLDQPFRARAVIDAAAAALLDAELTNPRAHRSDDAAWFAVQAYWHWRAFGDEGSLRATNATFALARERLLRIPLPATSDAAMLHVHALACAEAVSNALGETDAGLDCNLRARRLLDDHESAHWQEARSCFADGSDAPTLFGCTIGMLAATGDRIDRHVRSALDAPTNRDLEAGLVARAQFDLDRARDLESACLAAVEDPVAAGRRLDALAFAATGIRLASGPGVDERWMRVRPCLLPGTRELRYRGLGGDGWRLELGAVLDGETVTLRARLSPGDEPSTWRQLVAHLEGRVFVAAARAEVEVVLRSRDAVPDAITSPAR